MTIPPTAIRLAAASLLTMALAWGQGPLESLADPQAEKPRGPHEEARELGEFAEEFLKNAKAGQLSEALKEAIRIHGADSPQVRSARVDLAGYQQIAGFPQLTIQTLEEDQHFAALLKQKADPAMEDALHIGIVHFILATAHMDLFHLAEAERHYLAVRSIAPGFPEQAWMAGAALAGLGNVKLADGRYAEAEKAFRSALDIYITKRGPLHMDTLICRRELAVALEAQGKDSQAMREAFCANLQQGMKEGISYRANSGLFFALFPESLMMAGNAKGAGEHMNKVLEKTKEGRPHVEFMQVYARVLAAEGKAEEADNWFKLADEACNKVPLQDHPKRAGNAYRHAALLQQQGKLAEAEERCQAALKIQTQKLREGHPETEKTKALLGQIKAAKVPAQGAE